MEEVAFVTGKCRQSISPSCATDVDDIYNVAIAFNCITAHAHVDLWQNISNFRATLISDASNADEFLVPFLCKLKCLMQQTLYMGRKGNYRLLQCNRNVKILENIVFKAVPTNFTVPTFSGLLAEAMMGCICPLWELFMGLQWLTISKRVKNPQFYVWVWNYPSPSI